MPPELKHILESAIREATGEPFTIRESAVAGGGCIHQSRLLRDGDRRYFLKLNAAEALDNFEAEFRNLAAIHETAAIRVPRPLAAGRGAGRAYLILEALDFGPPPDDGWENMGRSLAALHRHGAESFGWPENNFIGSTPQSNRRHRNWAEFFREERLRPQFELAARKGFHFSDSEALLEACARLLAGHRPEPSLLHGDLWSGNAAFLSDGTPVLYDPAAYYGDREADLAFSEFFGGFPQSFYRAYGEAWPLAPGYEARKPLYNLYHVLNHANLFGGGYASQARTMISELFQNPKI